MCDILGILLSEDCINRLDIRDGLRYYNLMNQNVMNWGMLYPTTACQKTFIWGYTPGYIWEYTPGRAQLLSCRATHFRKTVVFWLHCLLLDLQTHKASLPGNASHSWFPCRTQSRETAKYFSLTRELLSPAFWCGTGSARHELACQSHPNAP